MAALTQYALPGIIVVSALGAFIMCLQAIRLSDSTDRPLSGADVTLHGQMADGATVGTPLDPGPEPGVYRGRVMMTAEGPRDLRLRVVQHDRRFELSLAHAVSW
jgi:hypothetical protein